MKLDYIDKKILAPMVRIGTLPMRLLSLDYGCDIVYSEELIDWKLIRSERIENVSYILVILQLQHRRAELEDHDLQFVRDCDPISNLESHLQYVYLDVGLPSPQNEVLPLINILGTIDFVDKTDGSVVFRTCSHEKDRVVLQMGTADPQRALQAAKLVCNDVAAIDVNMGCPKEFSVKGGMGAALLCDPDRAVNIMKTLVNGLDCPVTCKVRVLPDPDETVKLCQRLADTGIAAIAIHGRTKIERPQHPNHNDIIHLVAKNLSIPVIANGGSLEIEKYEDFNKFRKETGCDSVMVARAAQWNCSIFRKEGKLPLDEVITSYLKYCVDFDNHMSNSKYTIQCMLRDLVATDRGETFLEAQTLDEICRLWGMEEYCKKRFLEFRKKGLFARRDVIPNHAEELVSMNGVTELKCAFLRGLYKNDSELPKSHLLTWSRRQGFDDPLYETIQVDKRFKAVVTVQDKKYSSSFWEKNKRWSQQAAALACLCSLGVVDSQHLKDIGAMKCVSLHQPPEAKKRRVNGEDV